jgi:hypothetical protein
VKSIGGLIVDIAMVVNTIQQPQNIIIIQSMIRLCIAFNTSAGSIFFMTFYDGEVLFGLNAASPGYSSGDANYSL